MRNSPEPYGSGHHIPMATEIGGWRTESAKVMQWNTSTGCLEIPQECSALFG